MLDAELGGQTTSHPFFVTQVFNNEEGAWKLISFVFTTRTGGPATDYKAPVTPTLTLNNGVKMPQFGIGTFLMPGNDACYDAGGSRGQVPDPLDIIKTKESILDWVRYLSL